MDFYSAYGQGFVRVAACTMRTAIGEPATNADSVLQSARECHDDGVGLAVFPELTLSGYSIEDILMQDALLDGRELGKNRETDTVACGTPAPTAAGIGVGRGFADREHVHAATLGQSPGRRRKEAHRPLSSR